MSSVLTLGLGPIRLGEVSHYPFLSFAWCCCEVEMSVRGRRLEGDAHVKPVDRLTPARKADTEIELTW